MIWLYIILGLIGGFVAFVFLLIVRANIAAKKERRDNPTSYCDTLRRNIVHGTTPKVKVKLLQKLFEMAASGTMPAMTELWRLLDNHDLSTVHYNIIDLLSKLGPAAVEAHVSTFYVDDNGTLSVAGEEGILPVYTSAGKAGLKQAENLFPPRGDVKDYKRNFNLHLLNVIGSLGDSKNALRLLKEFKSYGKNDYWVHAKRTILGISERHPLPVADQLLFDYIWALDAFKSSLGVGGYSHSQTFGGTHEEIDKKIQAEINKNQKKRDAIDACYKKARKMISNNEKQAVEFFREKMSSYLEYV